MIIVCLIVVITMYNYHLRRNVQYFAFYFIYKVSMVYHCPTLLAMYCSKFSYTVAQLQFPLEGSSV